MDEEKKAQPVPTPASPKTSAPQSGETFRSLCVGARISQRMTNALRVSLGLKRDKKGGDSDFDKPCDPEAFKTALERLNPEA